MKIAVLSHDMDYSGAPLACLAMSIAIKSLGHTVHFLSPKNGPLQTQLNTYGITRVNRVDLSYDLYIPSTVLMLDAAHQLLDLGKRVIPIIHEALDFASHFSDPRFQHQRWNLDKFEACVCVSTAQREEFKTVLPSARLLLLEYCCLADILNEAAPPSLPESYFLYPGPCYRRKGQHRFIQMLESESYDEDASFVFVGAEPEHIAQFEVSPSIREKLHATRYVTPEQAVSIARGSRGVISMSESETKGLAVMDGLWFGKPVLLSQIGAFLTYDWGRTVRFAEGPAKKNATKVTDFIRETFTFSGKIAGEETQKICREIHSFASYRTRIDSLLGFFS